MKPTFFIIGAPKCGTTAVSEYLRSHDNVFFSSPKEPLFFAKDMGGRLIEDQSTYNKLFDDAVGGGYIAVGEGSANYLRSTVAVRNILDYQPNAKFIVMLRNPVELVQSLHGELVFSGEESIQDFSDAWHAEPERRLGNKIPTSCRAPEWLFYSDWGRIGSQYQRLIETAGKDRIHTVLFDDFLSDTHGEYRKLLNFLELKDDGRNSFPRINERKQIRYPSIQRSIALGEKLIGRPIRLALGRTKGLGIKNKILSWNSVQGKPPPPSADITKSISAYYRDEIALLGELLSTDLSEWVSK